MNGICQIRSRIESREATARVNILLDLTDIDENLTKQKYSPEINKSAKSIILENVDAE